MSVARAASSAFRSGGHGRCRPVERIAEHGETYDDLPLGTVDVSVIALARATEAGHRRDSRPPRLWNRPASASIHVDLTSLISCGPCLAPSRVYGKGSAIRIW
jgi:hypothetical protein